MTKESCEKWLGVLLGDGEMHLCDEVRSGAKEKGFSKTELRAARKKLGIKTFHQFDEEGETGNWFWYLEGC